METVHISALKVGLGHYSVREIGFSIRYQSDSGKLILWKDACNYVLLFDLRQELLFHVCSIDVTSCIIKKLLNSTVPENLTGIHYSHLFA